MDRLRVGTTTIAVLLLARAATAALPLDLANPAPRPIEVEFEISADLATVGAVFSAPVPASYSASGGFGTVVIDDEDYEAFAGGTGLDISDVRIRIDLATREAEAIDVEGTVELPPFGGYAFSWTLDSTRTAGFVQTTTSSFPPLFCTSQTVIDALCQDIPQLCGATCVIVPGAPYDPATGKLNLVGFEHQDGCGETGCLTIDVFTPRGDLRLSEAPAAPVPAAGPAASLALAAGLLIAAFRRLVRRGSVGRVAAP